MYCAWDKYLNLLPPWMRTTVDEVGRESLQELRLRIGMQPEMICKEAVYKLGQAVRTEDLQYCINSASRYSPWAAATTAAGFITAPGGHRIGICGEITIKDDKPVGFSSITSLCIRVARDFFGIAQKITSFDSSILIIGPPGAGKTTLLRDLIRHFSQKGNGSISVVDERQEIFPVARGKSIFFPGSRTDILSGFDKLTGIEAVLRSMGPAYIAVDEITAQRDCDALIHAGWCGVKLLATAHAETKEDIWLRPVYRPLLESKLFDMLVTVQKDKTWTAERMDL